MIGPGAPAEAGWRPAETEDTAGLDGLMSVVSATQAITPMRNEQVAQLILLLAGEVSFRLSSGQHLRPLDGAGDPLPVAGETALEPGRPVIAPPVRIARASPAGARPAAAPRPPWPIS